MNGTIGVLMVNQTAINHNGHKDYKQLAFYCCRPMQQHRSQFCPLHLVLVSSSRTPCAATCIVFQSMVCLKWRMEEVRTEIWNSINHTYQQDQVFYLNFSMLYCLWFLEMKPWTSPYWVGILWYFPSDLSFDPPLTLLFLLALHTNNNCYLNLSLPTLPIV